MRVGDDDAFGWHAGRCGNGCHERLALLVVEVDEIGLHAHVALVRIAAQRLEDQHIYM